jgi:hypothetical protein
VVVSGEATRRGREAQRGAQGHSGGRGMLGLVYMGLVGTKMSLWASLVRVTLGNPQVEFRTLVLARG